MKKYACLILFALLLNGCDDGDLKVDEIDFDSVTAASCDPTTNTLIYKLKEQESLLLQLPLNSLINNPTALDTLTYNIDNSSYRVVYRAYDGTVATPNICGVIPPKTPNVTEEWTGTAGKIKITTTQIISAPDATTGATRITGYNHNIVFKNITFMKPSGPQTQEEYIFGDYKIDVAAPSINYTNAALECTKDKQVYNYNASSYIMIENFDQNLFKKEATPAGQPREGTITATSNNIAYRTFTGIALTPSYFCGTTVPTNPVLNENWSGITGTVQVSTEISANSVFHTVVLKDVVLTRGNSSFKLGTSYVLGKVEQALN